MQNRRKPRRSRFIPAFGPPLEDRVLLASRGVVIGPMVANPPNRSARALNPNKAINEAINESYNAFAKDYLQAQGIYLSPASGQAPQSKRFFRSFIVQRLNLLSQQLTRAFLQVSGENTGPRARGPAALRVFLRRRITGPNNGSLSLALAGAGPDTQVIPEPGTVTGPAATLYTDQALFAIESARVATLNASPSLLRAASRR